MSVRRPTREDHSFLVLRENRLAFAAVTQLIDVKSRTAAPVVMIYGPSGTGKSHLARHAARAFREASSDGTIVSLLASQFADELAAASDTRDLPTFTRKYRGLNGLFICEDLQALDGRRETQEQFVALWNDLASRQTRILVTADRPPGELRGFNSRLINRLRGGVCVAVSRYGAASRERLVGHFAQSSQIPLTDEQSRRLARFGARNGHELSGLIQTIGAQLRSKPAADVNEVLDKLIGNEPGASPPSLNEIARVVAGTFGIRLADLRSEARDRRLAIPRQIGMYVMREIGEAQYAEIGEFFGGRTHSTVLHGCRRIKNELENDETLHLQYDQVCRRLRRSKATRK
jgi:chromosomal replication initiator protein